MVSVSVPATSANLGSGFDCLALALDLWLEVDLTVEGKGLYVVTYGEGSKSLPSDEDNLIAKVLCRTLQDWGSRIPPGIKLTVRNDIPLERGLGSSAAATVAGIMLAAELAARETTPDEIVQLAAKWEGHADNAAAAVYGGLLLTGLHTSQGILSIPVPLPAQLPSVLVAVPDLRVSTAAARKALPQQVELADAVFNAARVGAHILAWMQGDWKLLRQAFEDRIHQPYRLGYIPGGSELLALARSQPGVWGAGISGSGPTMIAVGEPGALSNLAVKWQECWDRYGVNSKTVVTAINRTGAYLHKQNRG